STGFGIERHISGNGTRILVCHGHKHSEEELAKMASRAHVDMILRGHTHEPALLVTGEVIMVNPGSPSLPKQEGKVPTVGLLEDGEVTIFGVDSGEVFSEAELP
ncbi:MAG: metallophosphoesterase family protein, partial [Actinobacteria bacterium]|nr:metallophosphoesterase family protein [Actinomycetota bacterium]